MRWSELPPYIKIVSDPGNNPFDFNMSLGFSVGLGADGTINIQIKDLALTSSNKAGQIFIERSSDEALKDTVSILALAASSHIKWAEISLNHFDVTAPTDTTQTPPTTKLLN